MKRPQSNRAEDRVKGGGNYFAKAQEGVEFFHSGSKTLDLALGGGWAEDRVANVVGDNSTGKTLIAIEAMTNFLAKYKKEGMGFYREREHAFDESYAEAIGLPIKRVDFGDGKFDTVEDMYNDIINICDNEDPDRKKFYVVDSLDSLTSEAEQDRDINDASYGGEKAKKMSELFRREIGTMARAQLTLMIISQTRDKIGVTFGKKWTRTGGKALNFYASQILYLAHLGHEYGTVKGIRRPIGDNIRAKVDKNKVGLPFRETDFTILFGFGIDDMSGCLAWAKEYKCEDAVFGEHYRGSKIKYENMLAKLDDADFRKELHRVQGIIECRYWEVEESFLPRRRKYG